ncbi:MAG: hypothetical protein AAGD23_12505 [Pseudomonadota bacterium]
MKTIRQCVFAIALALMALASISPAIAYDDGWFRNDFWSGEYPNGFTLTSDVETQIRQAPDPDTKRDVACTMESGATYHPWNQDRVASSGLAFVTYVAIETYVVETPGVFLFENEETGNLDEVSLEQGEEWTLALERG